MAMGGSLRVISKEKNLCISLACSVILKRQKLISRKLISCLSCLKKYKPVVFAAMQFVIAKHLGCFLKTHFTVTVYKFMVPCFLLWTHHDILPGFQFIDE